MKASSPMRLIVAPALALCAFTFTPKSAQAQLNLVTATWQPIVTAQGPALQCVIAFDEYDFWNPNFARMHLSQGDPTTLQFYSIMSAGTAGPFITTGNQAGGKVDSFATSNFSSYQTSYSGIWSGTPILVSNMPSGVSFTCGAQLYDNDFLNGPLYGYPNVVWQYYVLTTGH